MPFYRFALHDGESAFEDEGVWLANDEQAIEHAHGVARELMHARESQTRGWHIDVFEDGRQVYRVPFARIDPTLDHLGPQERTTVENLWESTPQNRSFPQPARPFANRGPSCSARAESHTSPPSGANQRSGPAGSPLPESGERGGTEEAE
jgi:Domain of unknown function (DUF6894)